MSEKLKPCPFCGGQPGLHPHPKAEGFALIHGFKAYSLTHNCMFGPLSTGYARKETLVARWNTRHGETEK